MTSVPSKETPRGRTRISSRAMSRVVSAVAAEALGVKPGQVSVDLTAAAESLDLKVRAPLSLLRQDDAGTTKRTSEDEGIGALVEQTQLHIRGTVSELTGTPIGDVSVRLTKARIRLPSLGD